MFKLHQLRPEGSDCTAPYAVDLGGEYTVEEFIRDVLLDEREWGYIGIDVGRNSIFGDPCCEYSHGVLKTYLPDEFMSMKVVSAKASGGWSNMDYLLTVEVCNEAWTAITDHYCIRHENVYGDDCYAVYRIGDAMTTQNYIAKFKHQTAAINECKYLERCDALKGEEK